MRLAFVRRAYRSDGGAERFLGLLMERLTQKGHEVHLFAERWAGTKGSGIVVHRVPVLPGPSFVQTFSFALGVADLLKAFPCDLVHSFERILAADLYRAGDGCHREWLVQRRTSEPLFRWGLHWVNPFHLVALAFESRLFAGGARLIVANSKKGKEEIIRHYGTPAERIEVLYNGVDLQRFRFEDRKKVRERVRGRWGIGLDEILLLFVGSGFTRKGLWSLVEALSLVVERAPGVKVCLLVVGRGKRVPYQRLARKLGIEDRLLFAGVVNGVQDLYVAADLFALPTLYDPFSNASLEAMAAGVPVITSRMNGASELIDGGRGGAVLQDPTDPAELAGHLLRFLDRDLRAILGREALEIAQAFAIDAHVERLLGLYDRLLQEGRGW